MPGGGGSSGLVRWPQDRSQALSPSRQAALSAVPPLGAVFPSTLTAGLAG